MQITSQVVVLWLLAALFIAAGIAHFTFLRKDFAQIVPPILPYPDAVVIVTGILEVLGGIGLLIPQIRFWTGIALILYLIAVFPANIYGAQNRIPILGKAHPSIAVRLPFQILLILLIWWSIH